MIIYFDVLIIFIYLIPLDPTAALQQPPRQQPRTYLPRRLDPFDHGQTHHGPGHQQTHCHLPVEASALRDAVGDVQRLAVPVVGGGRALLTLRDHVCQHNSGEDVYSSSDKQQLTSWLGVEG